MKNLLFLTSRFPPYPGGAETYADNLTDHLYHYGWNPIIITDKHDLTKYENQESIKFKQILPVNIPFDRLQGDTNVHWRVLQFGILDQIFDIVSQIRNIHVVHANSIETAILGRFIADQFKIPLIVTIHEHAPENQSFGEGRCQFAFKRLDIDALIAPSQFYYDRACRYGFPKSKIYKILHGIHCEKLLAAPRTNLKDHWHVTTDNTTVVLIGRIYEPKGIITFIESAKELQSDPRFKAIIVGPDGPNSYATEVRRRIKEYNLEKTVLLTGAVLPSVIPSVLHNADIIVAPSLAEGFGLTVVEAMILGVPVIASDVGGLSEIIKHETTGLLIQPKDAYALTNAIRRLMNSSSLKQRFIKFAQEDALKRFSSQRMAKETSDVYNRLVNEHKV